MMPDEATLLGYTRDELKRFFPETMNRARSEQVSLFFVPFFPIRP